MERENKGKSIISIKITIVFRRNGIEAFKETIDIW